MHPVLTRHAPRLALALARGKPLVAEYLDDAKPIGDAATTPFQGVSSSWIRGLRWTPEHGAEMATAKKSYAYPGIDKRMFRAWLSRQSKGKWWWNHIGYPGRAGVFGPMQNSRWTGPVHPLFVNNQADGPVAWGKFNDAPRVMAWLKSRISPHATPEHLAALTGWLPGTTMNALFYKSQGRNTPDGLTTEVSDPSGNYTAHRTITSDGNSKPQIENALMSIPTTPGSPYRGASGAVLLRQARAAYELGIPSINYFAGWDEPGDETASDRTLAHLFPNVDLGDPDENRMTGGLHWPLLGADGVLPPSYIRTIPKHILDEVNLTSRGRFAQSGVFRDLFTSPLARDYYVKHPTAHDGFVDTTPGSYSRKAIEHHVGKKAMEKGFAPPIPDQAMPKKPLHLNRVSLYPPHLQHLIQTGELHPDHYDKYFDK